MSDLSRILAKYQGTEEERQCANLIFSDVDVQMNDARLNHLAALTWNAQSCARLFAIAEKAIEPQENPWKTIYKALLLLHTFLLFGPELAVDKCVDLCKFVHPLQTYNSALVKKGWFSTAGGTDYGAPVRATATLLTKILMDDNEIRRARQQARQGQNSLVPLGHSAEEHNPSQHVQFNYGQALSTSVGAGYSLEAVPGMYEGRPARYFDQANDPRAHSTQGNHQITRDALAPSLLDLAFDAPAESNASLPPVDYLPAIQRQKELEKQLAEQQELLRKLTEQQQLLQQQQQQQQQQAQQQAQQQTPSMMMGHQTHVDPLLSLQYPQYPNPTHHMHSSFPPTTNLPPSSAMAHGTNTLLDLVYSAPAPSSMSNYGMHHMHAQPQMQPAQSMQPMQMQPVQTLGGGADLLGLSMPHPSLPTNSSFPTQIPPYNNAPCHAQMSTIQGPTNSPFPANAMTPSYYQATPMNNQASIQPFYPATSFPHQSNAIASVPPPVPSMPTMTSMPPAPPVPAFDPMSMPSIAPPPIPQTPPPPF